MLLYLVVGLFTKEMKNRNRSGGTGNLYVYTFEQTSGLTVTTDISTLIGHLNDQDPDYSSTVTTLPPIYNSDLGGDVVDNIVYVSDIYYYGEQDSLWTNRTFPPHFHDTFLSGGGHHTKARLESLVFSADSSSVTAGARQTDLSTLFAGNGDDSDEFNNMFRSFIPDINFGPDGALYILRRSNSGVLYSSSTNDIRSRIYRVDYTGDCKDLAFFNQNRARVEQRGTERNNISRYRFADPAFYPGATSTIATSSIFPNQPLTAKVYNIKGQAIGSFNSATTENGSINLWNGALDQNKTVNNGLYFIQYFNANGQQVLQRKQVF